MRKLYNTKEEKNLKGLKKKPENILRDTQNLMD
jgi:hypothetical protein